MDDIIDTLANINIMQPATFWWEPQSDITAYELSLCMTMFATGYTKNADAQATYDRMPETAQRHWRKEDHAIT